MKVEDILVESVSNATQYVLAPESRTALAKQFPPKYAEFIGHHITYQFGVRPGTPAPPTPSSVKVIGYADSGDGLEVLVVSINGTYDRPDGRTFHITWSLDRSKYSPKDSNDLLTQKRFTLVLPIAIKVHPVGAPERVPLVASPVGVS